MLEEIIILGQSTSWLEIIAMLTGLVGVWLTVKENIWCFPIGIINVSLYALLFLTPGVRLYADALLQTIYIILLFYGWTNWAVKKNKIEVIHPIQINKSTLIRVLILTITGTILLSFFLSEYTDASFPWLDSLLTCSSLAAQWMIAKKYIENWIVWIVVDVIYLPLYIFKQLPLTAVLYFIFLIFAWKGYKDWKKNFVINEI
jgi:nicotinamide mononucleotide transporter